MELAGDFARGISVYSVFLMRCSLRCCRKLDGLLFSGFYRFLPTLMITSRLLNC